MSFKLLYPCNILYCEAKTEKKSPFGQTSEDILRPAFYNDALKSRWNCTVPYLLCILWK